VCTELSAAKSGPFFAFNKRMKAIAVNRNRHGHARDFYLSTLAPVNHHRETQFRAADAVMLTVLFLEIAVFMRLFLAN
jgi:hypothetical protein